MSEPKTPTSQETKPAREIDEQTQKHIDRFLQGREVWNKWANEMLARKAELEKAGKWRVHQEFDNDRTVSSDTSIPEIQVWLDESYVDFSYLSFQLNSNCLNDLKKGIRRKKIACPNFTADFSFYIFPGEVNFKFVYFNVIANFKSTVFHEEAFFNESIFNEEVVYTGCNFLGYVHFCGCKFSQRAGFELIRFKSFANFSFVEFVKSVDFTFSVFEKLAMFVLSKFRISNFLIVRFMQGADFEQAKFKNVTQFDGTYFIGDINFNNTIFNTAATFTKVKFENRSDFQSILVKRAFNLAEAEFTSKVPNFTQANFAESPRLDHVEVLTSPKYKSAPKILGSLKWQRYFWKKKFISYLFRIIRRFPLKLFHLIYFPLHYIYKRVQHSCIQFFNTRRDKNEEAHYRALKRLAIQAHDHENEMKFFAGEIRARRHITDFANFLTHDFASSMRYWAGVAYELFSDFGRSFIRPALWWFACLWLFANLTLSGAGLEGKTKCHNSQLTPKEAAYTIGLKNSLLILGLTKTNIVKQAELCLYGLNKNGANKNGEADREPKTYNPKIKRTYQTKSTKADTTKTDIPFKAAVQGITHSLLSLLFIFLLLLAIRNQFKIK